MSRRDVGRGRSQSRGRSRGRGYHADGQRGSSSMDSLNDPDSERFRHSSHPGNRAHGNERRYPMGFKKLQELLNLPADVVVLSLLDQKSGYRILLDQDKIEDEKFHLLVSVLAHGVTAQSNKENLYELFNITCEQKFFDKLCTAAIAIKRLYPEQSRPFFSSLIDFLDAYANAVPTIAIDRIPDLIDACISVLEHLKLKGLVTQSLIQQYEDLQSMLTEAAKKWEQEKKLDAQGRRKRMYEMDQQEPPDDFKELSVLPTPGDISLVEKPFVRKNITQGKYKDAEHYLDVQFRLLREDFVRPLRNGIRDFRSDKWSKFRDVRIYRNVQVIGSELKDRKLIHKVQMTVRKGMRFENSKRLLYGNLLCFSNDNFRSLMLGSVAQRDVDQLKKGILGVDFESDVELFDLSRDFIMVESRAYFMPYKHVLKALQDMSGKAIPMAAHILHVEPNVDAPEYLGEGEKYDLRVLKKSKMMRNSEALNALFNIGIDTEEPEEDQWVHLKDVFVRSDLMTWPSEAELGLDSSQRRALRSALTRQLAIIQGPPGTGKTFIGLKLTQILLHNSHVWKDAKNPTPILVVCFTNHALDQFLEGMTSYTSNMVRVGSRTKSENIGRFQINSLLSCLHGSHGIPSAIHNRNQNLRHEVNELEYEILRLKQVAESCNAINGILSLDLLKDVVPAHLVGQLQSVVGNKKVTGWLLLNMQPEQVHGYGEQHKVKQPKKAHLTTSRLRRNIAEEMEDGEVSDDDEMLGFAEELHGIEEQDRLLHEDEGSDDETAANTRNIRLQYETTDHDLERDMNLAGQAYSEDETDNEAYFRYAICAGQRDALKIGLDLPENPELVQALETQQQFNVWNLDFPRRWQLYKYWLRKLKDHIVTKLKGLQSSYQKKSRALTEVRNQEYLYLMRHASVVGMTTTGAAQYSAVMQDLAPKIGKLALTYFIW